MSDVREVEIISIGSALKVAYANLDNQREILSRAEDRQHRLVRELHRTDHDVREAQRKIRNLQTACDSLLNASEEVVYVPPGMLRR